jgi:protein-disulfide isomerase
MDRISSTSVIVAALILGASIVGAALLLKGSLTSTREEIASVREAVEELGRAQPAAPSRPAARRGPDPAQRYSLNLDGSPAKGPGSAEVTVVEFSDFQCPFCSRVNPTMARIRQDYPDQVRIVFKHLPLRIHPKAQAAHAAAEAAHRQGRFWEMHDAIFADQANMSPERYRDYAGQIGLDLERYDRDLASDDVQQRVGADSAEAEKLGVTGTPAFFVNGRYLSGAQPYESFKRLIDAELDQG